MESFETYIQKTEEGIFNLNRLINGQKIDNSVRLYKAFRRMKTFGLSGAIVSYFRKNREKILNKIQGEKPNLKWFDFYKLGYLLSLRKS